MAKTAKVIEMWKGSKGSFVSVKSYRSKASAQRAYSRKVKSAKRLAMRVRGLGTGFAKFEDADGYQLSVSIS